MIFVEFLQAHPIIYLLLAGVIGLAVGSFANVVIYRLPNMLNRQWRRECHEFLYPRDPLPETEKFNLSHPASACPQCRHQLQVWENIPVLSYVLLKGRCNACKEKIPLRYPAVELLTALLTVYVAWVFGVSIAMLGAMLLTWSLIVLSFIDFDEKLLPDCIVLPMLWLGIIWHLCFGLLPLSDAVVGAIAGYLILWFVNHVFYFVTGKIGMGAGDFKLLAMLGAWLGWQMLPLVILLAACAGAVLGILWQLLNKDNRGKAIPFGPYLAIAGFIALIWGDSLISAYYQFYV